VLQRKIEYRLALALVQERFSPRDDREDRAPRFGLFLDYSVDYFKSESFSWLAASLLA